jgi:hypothetical protein
MKLVTFGDSFTSGYDRHSKWAIDYVNLKGYKPKIFSEIIAENMNIQHINFGIPGADNSYILESFFKNYITINDGDIVLINWSSIERFRVVTKDNRWRTMVPYFGNTSIDLDLSERTIEEMLVNRMSVKFIDEVNHWISYINVTNKHVKLIHWTPFVKKLNCHHLNGFNTISDETKNKFIDGHFSELGQVQLADEMMKIITETIKS